MTREEAIEQLQRHLNEVKNDFGWNVALIEALEMAISALKESSTTMTLSELKRRLAE